MVRPYLAIVAVIALAATLIAAIYFTHLELQWIAFLAGVLVAALLAMTSRASRAEWLILRRTVQLQAIKERLAQETRRRERSDNALVGTRSRLLFVDQDFPAVLAYVDAEERCRYHNQAFRDWLGLKAEQIDGRHMREVLDDKRYGEIRGAVRQALAGRSVHYQRTQKTPDGETRRMAVQCLPRRGPDGKVAGFYVLISDATGAAPAPFDSEAGRAAPSANGQEMFVDSFSEQVTGWGNAAERLLAAMEKDEFRLYCQRIAPLAEGSGLPRHYEILVRLVEEEENLIPPGSFFPLAEKFDLMPKLDRWVLRQTLKWAVGRGLTGGNSPVFCINVAGATLSDPDFAEFVREQLRIFRMPGAALCFELDEPDVIARQADAASFARRAREQGCGVALCGLGRSRVSFDLLRHFDVSLLKIDGNIILGILREPVALATVAAIVKVARTRGIITVAEFVESKETAEKLRDLGVDYAQGFGVSRPHPLDDLVT